MQRKPTLIILVAAASLCVAGCDRDQEEGAAKAKSGAAGAGGKEEKEKVSEEKAGSADSTSETRSALPPKERFAVFPADSDFIGAVSFLELRESAIFRATRDRILGEAAKGFAAFEKACGATPLESFDSLLAAGKSDAEKEVIVVLRGMKRAELEGCAEELAAGADRELEITRTGELTRLESPRGALWIAWLDEQTLVATMNPDQAFLEERVRGQGGLDQNRELMGLIAEVDPEATAWLVAKPARGSAVAGSLGIAGEVEALFASVALESGLALEAGLRMASPKAAQEAAAMAIQMRSMAKSKAKPLSRFVEKVEIADKERDVIIRLDLSDKDLQDLRRTLEKLAQDMDGLMGGM